MGNWGDDIDEELKQNQDMKVGLVFSFKTMIIDINYICENLRDWDDKHPRDCFRNLWISAVLMMIPFACFSHQILLIATLPFLAFYFFVLIKLGKAYKQFGYKRTGYVLTTIGAMILMVALSIFVQGLIWP